MIEIPKIFQKPEFRFCPILKHSKKSFTDHNNQNYKFDDTILLSYLKKNFNYGIMIGYGFDLAIDIDKPIVYEKIKDLLPKTLEQISAIKKQKHLLYKASYLQKLWNNSNSKHFKGYADFLGKGKYIVGTNSIVKNEKNPTDKNLYTYELGNENPIALLPKQDLIKSIRIVEEIYVRNKPIKKTTPKNTNPNIKWFNSQTDGKKYFNNPTEIIDIKLLYKNTQGQQIFQANFTDQDKIMSFGLNKPTERILLNILINGKTKAMFYTIIHNGMYMRQIKDV